jgi:hypothetical protein
VKPKTRAQEKSLGGRPPRRQKPVVRSYYIPVALANAFHDAAGGRPSRCIAGAMAAMMALPNKYYDQIVDAALDLPPAEAVKAVRELLPAILDEMLMERHIRNLPEGEKSRIIQVQRSKLPALPKR